MVNNAVVLVVDKFSLPVHIGTQVAGVKYPVSVADDRIVLTKGFFSILSDLSNIIQNTEIFFYQRRVDEPSGSRGFLGVWEPRPVSDKGYFVYEDTEVDIEHPAGQILARCPYCKRFDSKIQENQVVCSGCNERISGHILPLRIPIQPKKTYQKYLDDNTAYIDITDEGRLSTLIFRKLYGAGRERSVSPILPEESEKIRRLLNRVQHTSTIPTPTSVPHNPPQQVSFIQQKYLDFKFRNYLIYNKKAIFTSIYNSEGIFRYETILEFWLINKIAYQFDELMRDFEIASEERLEWFGNQVLFGIGGERSDIVLLFRNNSNKRCRAIVIELKRETIDNNTFAQLSQYAYWIAQLVTANIQEEVTNPFYITPITIGHHSAKNLTLSKSFEFIIPYSTPLTVRVETPRVFTYRASEQGVQLSRKV